MPLCPKIFSIFLKIVYNFFFIEELHSNFDQFGPLMVDWPHKAPYEVMPPKRFAFLIFSNHASVNWLMSLCARSDYNNYAIDHKGQKCVVSFLKFMPSNRSFIDLSQALESPKQRGGLEPELEGNRALFGLYWWNSSSQYGRFVFLLL